MNTFKALLFDLLRKYVIYRDSYDSNEDFICIRCCRPVLTRKLFCSRACHIIYTTNNPDCGF